MRVIAQISFYSCLCLTAWILSTAGAANGAPGPDEAVDPAVFAPTEGVWSIDGAEDAAVIEMDGKGHFTAYYASGAEEYSGYLLYWEEYEGLGRYDLYDTSDNLIMGFYFDSEPQFHVGNDEEEGDVYVKLNRAPSKTD